jgi:hypothetical protein
VLEICGPALKGLEPESAQRPFQFNGPGGKDDLTFDRIKLFDD